MVDRRRMRKPPRVLNAPLPGFARHQAIVAAVDAAAHTPAFAIAEGGELRAVGFDINPGVVDHPAEWYEHRIDTAVLEASRSYGAKDAGKHGDIIAESIGGALTVGSMQARRVAFVAPDEWAGQTKKPPRHRQVWAALTVRERELVAEATRRSLKASEHHTVESLTKHILAACERLQRGLKPSYSDPVHNLLDAVGLLLFAVGRLGRGGAAIRPQAERPRKVGT